MVLEAARLDCLDEVLVITAGLSVQDPRERPAEKRDAAAALHARFAHESSDFMSYLKLWDYLAATPGGAELEPVPQALPQGTDLLPESPRVAGRARSAERDLPAASAGAASREATPGPAAARPSGPRDLWRKAVGRKTARPKSTGLC